LKVSLPPNCRTITGAFRAYISFERNKELGFSKTNFFKAGLQGNDWRDTIHTGSLDIANTFRLLDRQIFITLLPTFSNVPGCGIPDSL
jgi:hypothetical protein